MRRYIIGLPHFGVDPAMNDFVALAGQQQTLAGAIIQRRDSEREVTTQLITEYRAIVQCLSRAGARLQVGVQVALTDWRVLGPLRQNFDLELFEFNLRLPLNRTCYPRDISLRLKSKTVVNSDLKGDLEQSVDWRLIPQGRRPIFSPLGEGGTTLASTRSVVTQERLVGPGGGSIELGDHAFDVVREAGLALVKIPLFRSTCLGSIGEEQEDAGPSVNNHLDRVAALITDAAGRDHLIVDPTIEAALFETPHPTREFEPVGVETWGPMLKARAARAGVNLRMATEQMGVPYALNLLQLENGNVVMTSGCEATRRQVEEIVGKGRVYTTDVPIQYYPTHLRAGLRCLTGDAPPQALHTRQRPFST